MLIHQIKVLQSNIGNETVQTVNARELHKALDNKRRFADWIKDRINDYGFVQNVDYVLISQNCEIKGRGGDRRSIDYHITLDMAKELSMVEKTEKGRQARRYFIDCEKRAYLTDLSLMVQIADVSAQVARLTDDLSVAGRVLCQGGKVIKPRLVKQLKALESQLQPSLPFANETAF
ncbi:antA/AntB antirepressor family protein [Moraxella sp. ZY200743]|uniref:antA/AntB antirepressor family protein n=1 Tax=Moraxella sp. ZY200743 TaxID=2911970 RepID=UPI003D7C50D7